MISLGGLPSTGVAVPDGPSVQFFAASQATTVNRTPSVLTLLLGKWTRPVDSRPVKSSDDNPIVTCFDQGYANVIDRTRPQQAECHLAGDRLTHPPWDR